MNKESRTERLSKTNYWDEFLRLRDEERGKNGNDEREEKVNYEREEGNGNGESGSQGQEYVFRQ